MYFPYFRGKQYELITIRENAKLLHDAKFVPIIEPVKESLSGLIRAIDAMIDVKGQLIVIANPFHGDHADNSENILDLLTDIYSGNKNIVPGILLSEETTVEQAKGLYDIFADQTPVFVHKGFTQAKGLVREIGSDIQYSAHVFNDVDCGKLYQKHFKDSQRVLLRDGFERRKNREHPPVEFFSDLHATYEDEAMDGFGDYLTVGDDYSETGGPAYAIAIHLTFIDDDKDDEMHIHHFVSIRQDDPKDPAGKFAEALDKMAVELGKPDTKILRTNAVGEFLDLHRRGHFPGLGYVKKLSMQHHLETLADYFENT